MKGTATIVDAKMSGAKEASWNDRTPKARMRLTVDIDMPVPSEPKDIAEWFDAELQRSRSEDVLDTLWASTQPSTNGDAPAAGEDVEDDAGEVVPSKKKGKTAKPKPTMPWNWKPSPALLRDAFGHEYDEYVESHRHVNQRALRASQEAGLLLLLIGKQVSVTIQPAQKAFAALLKFDDDVQLLDEPAE